MPIDSRAFRHTAAQFATGVTVVSLDAGGEVRALTANSFSSLSLDPPLVLFCLGRQARAAQIIHSARRFCVNILGDHQRDLSAFFAGAWKAPAPPRFSFVKWEEVPRLEGCLAAIACEVRAIHEGGDHWIVVGEVVGLHRLEHVSRPLVFYGGGYVNLETPQVKLDDAPIGIAWSGPTW
jgi:3-hydroxy-9,10-secoandrosta-1,3,5(10)-triene-9,17-dione monooxygenase reductase component